MGEGGERFVVSPLSSFSQRLSLACRRELSPEMRSRASRHARGVRGKEGGGGWRAGALGDVVFLAAKEKCVGWGGGKVLALSELASVSTHAAGP